jgi:ubiquinone/menaquinone biosynthesis C-methylase UbiE
MSSESHDRVRTQFGRSADAYATSEIHAQGESLGVLLDLLGFTHAAAATDRSDQRSSGAMADIAALDVATGAGHTAIAISPNVERVVATDITEEMLAKTRELATARGCSNLQTQSAAAEALPFADQSFDLVTCRLAFHHFEDQAKAAAEMARVVKPGGLLGFTDNLTVEDESAARYYNEYEALRDPSHNRVLSLGDLIHVLETAGFIVQTAGRLAKELEFHEWADRQRVADAEKDRLLEKMRNIPPALVPLFAPRWADGTMYFSLWEGVLLARRR